MNSKKTLALGVGVCALALTAVATPVKAADTNSAQSAITQTYQPKAQDVTINYNANAGIAVWTAPSGKTTGKFIGGQTTAKVAGSQVVNGHTWYLLADNSGWIDGSYVKTETTSTKTTTTTNTNTTNKTTTTTKTPAKTQSKTTYAEEIVTAGNNGAAVYSAPNASAKTSRVLSKGSNWKSFYRVENGSTWYNLGGNQFVLASDLASNNTSSSQNKPADTKTNTSKTNTSKDSSKVSTVAINEIVKVQNTKGAVIYSKPETSSKTSRVLSNGSRWKAFEKASNDGANWYNLGGNQWILASDVDGSAVKNTSTSTTKDNNTSSTIKTVKASGVARVNYKPGYGIMVWAQPGSHALGKTLEHGTNWKFFAVANALGRTWYNLGGNQWVDGQYLVLNNTSSSKPASSNNTTQLAFSYGTVNYKPGYGIAIWSAPNGKTTGQYMQTNDFVNINETTNDNKWLKVSNPLNGKQGWVQRKYIKNVYFDDQR